MDFFGIFFVPNWLAVVIVLTTALYVYFTWNFNYWESQNVKVFHRKFPVLGTFWTVCFEPVHIVDMKAMKHKEKVWGLYDVRLPVLMVTDLEMIKTIMVKEFNNFPNRRKFPVGGKSAIARLFLSNMKVDEWRVHRPLLSPTFTTGKLKQMTGLMGECGEQMIKEFAAVVKQGKSEIEMKMKFGGYAMDVIARCCFNYKINSQDANDQFIHHAKMLFNNTSLLFGFVMFLMPKLIEILEISFFPKKCLDFFENVVHQVVGMRKQENIRRNDFLQMLMDAQAEEGEVKPLQSEMSNPVKNENDESEPNPENAKPNGKKVLTNEALVAHAVLFLLAGFDTTATTTSLAAYLLALNPECQEKLMKEIDETIKQHGKLTYEVVMEMQYLDMVLSESLRYFPPGVRIERRCMNDTKLGDIEIKKEIIVSIPVYALHHDEQYYPDPEKFDPERFNAENKAKRNPVTYLPFGMGPRNCIGMRFALIEVKIALAHFFREYKVSPSRKTAIPMKFRKGIPLLLPVDGVYLNVERR